MKLHFSLYVSNHQNENGHTALHLASSQGHIEVLKILLPYIDPSIKDNDGRTASDFAQTDEIKEFIRNYSVIDIKEPVSTA